jgi:hypothetical protein
MLAVGAVMLLGASTGSASAATTRFVSHAPIGAGTSCAHPAYNTVQDAINASSPGDLIRVCGGTYTEQLTVSTGAVTIKGAGEAATTIALPASPATSDGTCGDSGDQTIVEICGGATVGLTNLKVQGTWASDICNDQLYGITVYGGGTLHATNVHVTDIGGDPQSDGCQGGIGVRVGRFATSQVGTASLSNVTVDNYQKGGIVISGAGSRGTVGSSTVTGTGETTAIAQNGIQISGGATGSITNSTVTGNECDHSSCGPDGLTQTQSCGILLFSPGTTPQTKITGNVVSGNDIGVYNFEDPVPSTAAASISGNSLANRYENVELDQGFATVSNNTMTGGEAGIQLILYSTQDGPVRGTAINDTISGASDGAVQVLSDNDPGDGTPQFAITSSDLSGSSVGVDNEGSVPINAKNDWWGDANGASGWSFGAGSSVSANVNVFPWYTDSGKTTLATCTAKATNINDSAGNPYDILCGTSGNNLISYSGPGPVLELGNGGNDHLIAGNGSGNFLVGSSGNDVLDGNGGSGYIQGRGGSDTCLNDGGYTTDGC